MKRIILETDNGTLVQFIGRTVEIMSRQHFKQVTLEEVLEVINKIKLAKGDSDA